MGVAGVWRGVVAAEAEEQESVGCAAGRVQVPVCMCVTPASTHTRHTTTTVLCPQTTPLPTCAAVPRRT